jgi:hypothetical protein
MTIFIIYLKENHGWFEIYFLLIFIQFLSLNSNLKKDLLDY